MDDFFNGTKANGREFDVYIPPDELPLVEKTT